MTPEDAIQEAAKASPGIVGSLVSLRWIEGTWLRKLHMFLAGCAMATYAAPNLAAWSGMNPGLASFCLGVFGMSVIAKMFDTWSTFAFSALLEEWIRKVLGLAPKLPKLPDPPKSEG